MSLRKSLGRDVQRVFDQVDALLDREDGVLMLFDGRRVVTYAEGFGVSASQLELLGMQLEHALRSVVGRPAGNGATQRRNRDRNQGTRRRDRIDRDAGSPVDQVLRLAGEAAQPTPRREPRALTQRAVNGTALFHQE